MGILSTLFSRKPRASATEAYGQLLQPGKEHQLLRKASELTSSGNQESAVELLNAGIMAFPDSKEIKSQAESLELSLAKFALRDCRERLNTDPTADLRVEVSELHRRLGENREAILIGREAIRLNPDSASGYRAVGRVFFDQFKNKMGSADGINALRYLSKAHALSPSNSLCILQLAEVFLILQAPSAANRFLAPVKKAFKDDPLVNRLIERSDSLPVEDTSQIQELFVRHEKALASAVDNADTGETVQEIDIAAVERAFDSVRKVAGMLGVYIIDSQRKIHAGFYAHEIDKQELPDSLGLIADTAKVNSPRMGVGSLSRLSVTIGKTSVVIDSLSDALTSFVITDDTIRIPEIDSLVEKLAAACGSELCRS